MQTKAVLLGRAHDLSPFTSNQANRELLQHVCIDADRKLVEASDGRILAQVPLPETHAVEYPPSQSAASTDGNREFGKAVVPAGKLAEFIKAAPKKPKLPVLKHAHVSREDEESVRLFQTDVDHEKMEVVPTFEGSWVDTSKIPPKKKPKATVRLQGKYLEAIGKYVRQHADEEKEPSVTVELRGELEAVVFRVNTEHGEAKFTLMPMRPR